MKRLSLNEIYDMCIGASVLGSGGGGDPHPAMRFIEKIANTINKDYVEVVDPQEIPDESLSVCVAGVASIAPTEEGKKVLEEFDRKIATQENVYLKGVKKLEEYLKREIFSVAPFEMGGYNTAVPVMVSLLSGMPVLNGDPVGRAVPEVEMQTFALYNIPPVPSTIYDVWGNNIIVTEVTGYEALEKIARAMAEIGGAAAYVGGPVKGKMIKKAIISGTVLKAVEIGKSIRKARESNKDPIEAIIKVTDGAKIFEGIVNKFEWEDKGGFMYGNIYIEGKGEYHGDTLRIWVKNENLVSWINEKPYVTCPDIITLLDPKTGYPIPNSKIEEGMHVIAIGIPASPIWRTPEGLELLSPRHFGFEIEYTPLEVIIKNWR